METKTCTSCGQNKSLEEFYFVRTRNHRMSICDTCRKAKGAVAYLKNREVALAKSADYYQKNQDVIKARVSAYQKENRAAATKNHRRWKAKQPPGALAAQIRARRAADPNYNDKQNARNAARRPIVNEHARIRAKARYHQDIEASRAKHRAVRSAKREYYKILGDAQRAKKHGTVGRYSSDDVAAILMAQKGKCAYCRKDIRKSFEVDHIVPFIRGGTNNRNNLQLTCGPCNRSKGGRDPLVHARRLGLLL